MVAKKKILQDLFERKFKDVVACALIGVGGLVYKKYSKNKNKNTKI